MVFFLKKTSKKFILFSPPNSSSSLDRFYGADLKHPFFFICQSVMNGTYEYKLIPQSKNWYEAQKYCLKEFDDLAVINDVDNLNASVKQRDFPVWVGLRRDGKTHCSARGGFCTS